MTKKELNNIIKDHRENNTKIEITYPFSIRNIDRMNKDIEYMESMDMEVISSTSGGIIGFVAWCPVMRACEIIKERKKQENEHQVN